jgi:hypothetical protein
MGDQAKILASVIWVFAYGKRTPLIGLTSLIPGAVHRTVGGLWLPMYPPQRNSKLLKAPGSV